MNKIQNANCDTVSLTFTINSIQYRGKKTKLARLHLKEVCEILAKLDPHLSEIASNSKPTTSNGNNSPSVSPKKRKATSDLKDGLHIPKKKNARSNERSESTPTLSQREESAMKNLTKYILELGGKVHKWYLLTHFKFSS